MIQRGRETTNKLSGENRKGNGGKSTCPTDMGWKNRGQQEKNAPKSEPTHETAAEKEKGFRDSGDKSKGRGGEEGDHK